MLNFLKKRYSRSTFQGEKYSPPDAESFQSEKNKSKEQIQHIAQHVIEGKNLILSGQYDTALRHFKDDAKAKELGVKLLPGAGDLISSEQDLLDPEAIRYYSNTFAKESMYFPDRTIHMIQLSSHSINMVNLRDIQNPSPMVKTLQYECALVALEEWLHLLQDLMKSPVAGERDSEVDVAKYMIDHGIQVSDNFLRRYDRGKLLDPNWHEEAEDYLEKNAALRRGSFIKVYAQQPTNELWQVITFHEKTGAPVACNLHTGERRTISRELVARLNNETQSPFAQCQTFEALYKILNHISFFSSFDSVYPASEIKSTISAVIRAELPLELLPRTGGLRMKVYELMKQAQRADLSWEEYQQRKK